jgi:hypothetical protein
MRALFTDINRYIYIYVNSAHNVASLIIHSPTYHHHHFFCKSERGVDKARQQVDATEVNTPGNPTKYSPQPLTNVATQGSTVTATLPPRSFTVITFDLSE